MKLNRVLSLLLLAGMLSMTATLPAAPAWAKAGKSSSMGSRGSKTYSGVSPTGEATAPAPGTGSFLQHNSSSGSAAQPITRSTTPPAVKAVPTGPAVQSESLAPMAVPREQVTTAAPAAMPGQAMPSARSSFFSGLAGGLIGAGIGSFIFGGGHSFFGEGSGGFLGTVIQLALIFFVGRWLLGKFLGNRPTAQVSGYRRDDFIAEPGFSPREPSFDQPGLDGPNRAPSITAHREPGFGEPVLSAAPILTAPAAYAAHADQATNAARADQAPRPANPRQFVLSDQDLGAIETLLVEIQGAWSTGDGAALQRLATPEMAGYFNEQLSEDRARGLENRVEQVRLLKGDVNETWREGPLDYATVTLQWTAVDYTLSHSSRHPGGEVVAGDPDSPVETVEVWTILRSPGAPWILSAIQQV
ncbi:MAG TPA: TIM44-like domain-containing protein [Candidatus Sulfotelmatobacter sp.]|nr:TIM44-like domain-containing protein [Candidatus Sulfotelmatobacter sp.]